MELALLSLLCCHDSSTKAHAEAFPLGGALSTFGAGLRGGAIASRLYRHDRVEPVHICTLRGEAAPKPRPATVAGSGFICTWVAMERSGLSTPPAEVPRCQEARCRALLEPSSQLQPEPDRPWQSCCIHRKEARLRRLGDRSQGMQVQADFLSVEGLPGGWLLISRCHASPATLHAVEAGGWSAATTTTTSAFCCYSYCYRSYPYPNSYSCCCFYF